MTSVAQDRLNGARSSLAFKAPCRVASIANITLSGEQTIDSVAVVTGDRVLVTAQTSGINNGLYIADTSAWERAPDCDGTRDLTTGTIVRVFAGSQAGFWELTTTGVITVGSTSLSWTRTAASLAPALTVSAFMESLLDETTAAALRLASAQGTPKHIAGLVPSNNVADATNDIDISAGAARDGGDAADLYLTAAITKRLDAAWAVGTGNGGLDTGAIGNLDYYIWLIKRPDTGVVDVTFSLSATAPTLDVAYTLKRLIGWIKRSAGAIVAFKAYELYGGGLEYSWMTPILDVDLSNTLTTAKRTDALSVPLNFSVISRINIQIFDASVVPVAYIYNPDLTDLAPSGTVAPLATTMDNSLVSQHIVGPMLVRTDATGKIASRANIATVDTYRICTLGFYWGRRA